MRLSAEHSWQRSVRFFGEDHLVSPEPQCFFPLPGVFGDADYAAHFRQSTQSRDGEEPHAARPDDERRVFRAGVGL